MSVPVRESYLAARRMSNGRLGIIHKHIVSTPHLKPNEQRAQATMMMMRRLFGESTVKELGMEFGVDPRTVNRRLELARTDGVPDEARRVFIDEMLPASMAVLKEALSGGDMKLAVQVAIKVVEGLRAMEHPAVANPPTPSESSTGVDETLEVWRARVTRRSAPSVADPSPTIDCIDAVSPGAAEGSEAASPAGPACIRLGPDLGAGAPAPPPAAPPPGPGLGVLEGCVEEGRPLHTDAALDPAIPPQPGTVAV